MVLGRDRERMKENVVHASACVSVYVKLKDIRSVIYYLKNRLSVALPNVPMLKATVCICCSFRSSLSKDASDSTII